MTRTQWTVVVSLLVFILVVFGVLLIGSQPARGLPIPLPPAFLLQKEAQARTVFSIAQQEALRWQEDAQLSSARIVWDDLGPGGVLLCDRWSFDFYSPAQQQMAVIRVTDGTAERLRTALLPNRLPILPLDQWQVDSTQALQAWWERGGSDFVGKHTHVSISLKLRVQPGGTRPVWSVAGSSSGQHLVAQLDARDGTVLE